MIKDGAIVNIHSEIIINPHTRIISIESAQPNGENKKKNAEIENFDCDFNRELTNGRAVYRAYTALSNGNKEETIIQIESKDGDLAMSSVDPDNQGELIILINKWEVVNQ